MRSKLLKLNLNDFTKGFIIFTGSALLNSLYQFISKCGIECVDWNIVANVGLSAAIAYLLKNYFTDQAGRLGGKL